MVRILLHCLVVVVVLIVFAHILQAMKAIRRSDREMRYAARQTDTPSKAHQGVMKF